ncbi:hypothetical protein EXQ33_05250 [Clostridium botulinum]|nr:hypothetical protein [Clostridium botulinum]
MVAIKNINDKMFNLSKPKFIFAILLLNFIISVLFIPIKIFYETYAGPMGGVDIKKFNNIIYNCCNNSTIMGNINIPNGRNKTF